MKKIFAFYILMLLTVSFQLHGQLINGTVYELDTRSKKQPVEFANVYWSGTSHGTITDDRGKFEIEKLSESENKLIISFVGYLSDTVEISAGQQELEIVLSDSQELDEVTVKKRIGGSYISRMKPIQTEVITRAGLQKLPCCNLSESFENSATIDVGYSDAVTGAKHIKLLGLAGTYSQILLENMPFLRGLESPFGLNYVPGPWMQSIQVSKGAAAVINGYESTTGQINLEYFKPQSSDPIFINLFVNTLGRTEANILSAAKLTDKWSTMILTHGSAFDHKLDRNKDTFMDVPMNKQINFFNRWKYNPEGDFRVQFGVNIMAENRRGGQSDYDFESDNGMSDYYGIKIDTRKFYGYGKIGMLFPGKPYNSIGFMTSATVFSLDGLIGPNKYSGEQMSYYSNLIYQSIILSTNHTYNIGFSFLYDRYDEILNDRVFEQTEIIPGIFGQYTYTKPDKFNGILGLRADRNSRYGLLVTPRGHIRYDLGAHTTFRASAGKGYRSAHALAENMGIIASSRTFYFNEEFEIESAWNYGMNLNRNFHMGNNKEINVSLDLYRTDFQNQIIVDMDRDISGVYFYNLKGRSYSNSFQAQVSITPVEHFDITAAFRFNDVKSTINGTLQEVPLTARYKGLLTLSYATWYNKWSFDLTTQLNGQNRLPDTRMNPSEYQKDEYSPEYVIIHAQVTKRFKYFDIYIGGENLTDFMQEDPVIAPDDPFGEYFDASMVWGPLMGRTFYAGIRYTLKNKS